MGRVGIIAVVLLGLGCGAQQDERATTDWRNDFPAFLKVLQEAAQQHRVEETGAIDLDALNGIFVDQTVTWEGTLKYVNKGRPHITESFVRVDSDTKIAAVMYYPDPGQVEAWEQIEPGARVTYTGIIKAVHLETGVSKEPFPWIDLKNVQPVQPTQ